MRMSGFRLWKTALTASQAESLFKGTGADGVVYVVVVHFTRRTAPDVLNLTKCELMKNVSGLPVLATFNETNTPSFFGLDGSASFTVEVGAENTAVSFVTKCYNNNGASPASSAATLYSAHMSKAFWTS
eukprot:tig00000985_g6011.t1